ncbi:hypothetical protein [Oerskovia enterophila]|uniref:hypothetical protein n=1 Tax=Oerskovia enterophila TaxID=43678 RepID=UPI0038155DFA
MTRIDDQLQALSRSVAHETTGLSPEVVALQVRRVRRRRRTAVGGTLGALSLAVAVAAGAVDWSAIRTDAPAPAEAPAVVEPLAGDTIQCGTPESEIVPTTTLTLTDVNPWEVEVTNVSDTPFFAASNGSARTVLVQDGRVVAMTLMEGQPLVPVDVGPGESQVLGVAGAQVCTGGEDDGTSVVPAGTYTAYRVLQVDELAGPDALDTWDGTNGTPVSIVSAPSSLEVTDIVDASSFACGASVPDHLVVEAGLQLVAGSTGTLPGDQTPDLSLSLTNGTASSVTVDVGWGAVHLVQGGVVVAQTVGFPDTGSRSTLAPHDSVPVSFAAPDWCPGVDATQLDPSRIVAYGTLDLAPATGKSPIVVPGGPWRVSDADVARVGTEIGGFVSLGP